MIKKTSLWSMVLLLVFPLALWAQSPPPEEIRKKVDTVFAAYNKPDSPGCALGVIQDGRLIYARGVGMSNLEHGIPITSKTVFDLGSTSKQFTAAAILLLGQQGKLSLDDDIRKHIPEVPDYGRKVTIRHLLHHTSGIRDYLTLMTLAGVDFDGVTNEDDALSLIARQKALNFPPGEEHLYSNSGYFLLSVIAKRVSGRSLRQFAAENMFGPLGMQDTHFHDDHTMIVPRRATGYAPAQGGGFRIAMSGFEQTGDGAVFTTVEDLLAWDKNFYEPKVGGQQLIDELLVTGVLNNAEKLTYARGLVVDKYKGLRLVSHGGSWAGYRADFIRFPEQRFSVICLCNVANAAPSRLAREVSEFFLKDRLAGDTTSPQTAQTARQEAVTVPESALKQKVGLYRNMKTGALRRITLRSEKLWMDSFAATTEMAPLAENNFRLVGVPTPVAVTFELTDARGLRRFQILREGSKPEEYEAVAAFSPTLEQLKQYVATYYSEELDVFYSIRVDGDKLTARAKDRPARTLQPAYKDAFVGPGGGQFEFQRDGRGSVTGFALNAGRVRGISFVRKPGPNDP